MESVQKLRLCLMFVKKLNNSWLYLKMTNVYVMNVEKLKKLGVKMKKEHALPNGLLPLEESDSEGDSEEGETADA